MKRLKYLILLFGLMSYGINAQNDILGIAKESKSISYYNEQFSLWKTRTAQQPKDGHAWFQYYKARRAYLQKTKPEVWKNNQQEIYSLLKPIIADAKKYSGNSYEYYIMESMNTLDRSSIEFTKKAFAKDPNRVEAYEGLLIHYVLTFQEKEASEVAKKMLEQNYFSNANLKWNWNALQTVSKDGVFIANGDMDAIPKWVLQYGKGIRKDVLVLSKWMLYFETSYRKTAFKKLNLKEEKSKSDFKNNSEYVDYLTVYIMKNAKSQTYMACGTSVDFFDRAGIDNDIYLVGTAFVYSTKQFDNLETTRLNFEEKYDLEYLVNNFQTHPEDNMVKTQMNLTYIPGLMKLKTHFEKNNQPAKAKHYSSLIKVIAEESGREEEIKGWYK